jgi:hypothetical protein
MRKFVCAAVFTFVAFSFAVAEEISALIVKCDATKNCIEYKKFEGKGKDKKAGDTVYKADLTKDAKIVKGKKDADDPKKQVDGDAIENGLKNDMFSNEKGVTATLFIADDGADKGMVTKIRTAGKGKKGGN